jgi:hypothetical protein
MSFTDTQEMLWDDVEDLKLRRRNEPLDEHPQEWYSKHYIITMTTTLGRKFYMWDPGQPVIWTEEKTGGYRYSNSKIGRVLRNSDMNAAALNTQERGVDGKVTFEIIN